jgi:hypothetical protein
MWNGVSKNLFFYTDFKKGTFVLSKKCNQNKFCRKKKIFWDLANFSIGKKVFWLKLFLGALFTKFSRTFLKFV